jgi:hypothetical protein
MVQVEGFGKLKKFSDLIGIGTRNLRACSIAPQQTSLQRRLFTHRVFTILLDK